MSPLSLGYSITGVAKTLHLLPCVLFLLYRNFFETSNVLRKNYCHLVNKML